MGAIVLTVVLLLANAIFVAFEFALVAARRSRIEQLAADGSRRARLAVAAQSQLSLQIAGVQLGVTIASLGLGAVAEPAASRFLRSVFGHLLPDGVAEVLGFVVALSIVVFAHTVFGEMVPKNLALAGADRTLLWLATPMRVFIVVFGPIVKVLDAVAALALRALRIERRDELAAAGTAEEIFELVNESARHGLIQAEQHRLLSGAMEFGLRPVAHAMVARHDIVAVPESMTVADVEASFVKSGHSRLPVFGRDLDHVLGFVHAKDLLVVAADDRQGAVGRHRLRRLLLVGLQRPLGEVLVAMQRSRRHLGLVVDRDGRTVGVISLEDILEELVGEIADETDR